MKKADWKIERLPGSVNNVTELHRFNARNRGFIFAKTADGKVYAVFPSYPIDLTESYSANETVRRIYCRLTGRSMKELRDAISKRRQDEAKRNQRNRLQLLRDQARRAGYRLTKVGTT